MSQPDAADFMQGPNYMFLSYMLLLSGRVDTPEAATKLAREFFAADIPEVNDLTRNLELEMTWIMRRLKEGTP